MLIKSRDIEEIVNSVKSLALKSDEAVFIMIGENQKPDISKMIEELNVEEIIFFGGIFPSVIFGKDKFDTGVVLSKIKISDKPILVKNLSAGSFKLPEFTEIENNTNTALVLVDGLTSNISSFLSELFNCCGNSVHYFGGGAGSLSLKQSPCLFTNEGLFQDCAIISFLPLKSKLGVKHGWKKIKGPLVATKTEKNIIIELNWENAFDVYKKTIEEDSNQKINSSNFFDIAKGYPFGMYKEGLEDIVRDPIAVNDAGELICVGEVLENTVLNILRGDKESLINAAGSAAEQCEIETNENITNSIIMDCISRVLFLEDDFHIELMRVESKLPSEIIPVGVLTLGEISSYGEGYLEFFNKTTVVGVFYE